MLYPPTPYSLKEEVYWIWKNIFLCKSDPGILPSLESDFFLNSGIVKYNVGFAGDLMGIGRKRLVFSQELKTFFADCDYLVMNMESLITEKFYPGSQTNTGRLLESLAEFFPTEKTFLSLANNHSGDFGYCEFCKSMAIIKKAGFNLFGTAENPSISFNERI